MNVEPAPVRAAAMVLIAASLFEVLGLAHHPSVHPHDAQALSAGLQAYAGLAATVHGVLIALLVALLLALSEYSVHRGMRRAAVRGALLCYGIGVVLMICAGLVSGFVTPRVAGAASEFVPPDAFTVARLAAVAMLFNQAFAKSAAILMSLGIGAWSLDLMRERVWLLGGFGVLCGSGCALAVASGALRLDVPGMMAVTVAQALWTVGLGVRLLRTPRPPCEASASALSAEPP